MLHLKIREEIQQAMRERNATKLSALRNVLAAFTNELVAKRRKLQEILSDEDALTVIGRLAKQRKDSIGQFKAGNRPDLVEKEERDLAEIERYLPARFTRIEIEAIVHARAAQLEITDKSQQGQLMGVLMKELKGKADGNEVKEVVEEMFKMKEV